MHQNHVLAYNFVMDRTQDGMALRHCNGRSTTAEQIDAPGATCVRTVYVPRYPVMPKTARRILTQPLRGI